MKHIFIVNPIAGRHDRSDSIRRQLEDFAAADSEFDYLFFISEHEGHETELAEQLCGLFSGEKIRLYACGGSGTLQHVLNGTIGCRNVETAFYPIGFTNDFIKCFNFSKNDYSNIANLINGRTVTVDSIDADGIRGINTAIFGITAQIIHEKDIFRMASMINPNIPYAITSVAEFLFQKTPDFELVLDGEDYSGKYIAIMIFNGAFLGGSIAPVKTANPTDGRFDVVTLSGKVSFFKAVKILSALQRGNLDGRAISEYINVYSATDVKVRQKNARTTVSNFDGEFYTGEAFHIENHPSQLEFVVPEKVTLKSSCGEKHKVKRRDIMDFPLGGSTVR